MKRTAAVTDSSGTHNSANRLATPPRSICASCMTLTLASVTATHVRCNPTPVPTNRLSGIYQVYVLNSTHICARTLENSYFRDSPAPALVKGISPRALRSITAADAARASSLRTSIRWRRRLGPTPVIHYDSWPLMEYEDGNTKESNTCLDHVRAVVGGIRGDHAGEGPRHRHRGRPARQRLSRLHRRHGHDPPQSSGRRERAPPPLADPGGRQRRRQEPRDLRRARRRQGHGLLKLHPRDERRRSMALSASPQAREAHLLRQ